MLARSVQIDDRDGREGPDPYPPFLRNHFESQPSLFLFSLPPPLSRKLQQDLGNNWLVLVVLGKGHRLSVLGKLKDTRGGFVGLC